MGQKMLMKGNEAIAEAAIQAGCRFFFGYPITPQNQIPEYMSKRLPKMEGGCFLQASGGSSMRRSRSSTATRPPARAAAPSDRISPSISSSAVRASTRPPFG